MSNVKIQTTNVSSVNLVTEKMKNQIIAEYKKAEAEAQKAAAEAAEAEAIKKAEAEAAQKAAEAAEAAAVKKAELKAIQQGKKKIDNTVLAELLPFDVAFKYAIADIASNGIMSHLKAVQKDSFKESQFEQLTKSLNLCLKQFSNDDLAKYVSDNRCTLPSKFITAIVNGSCKSAKAFDNSKAKVLPKNDKLS